MLQKYKDKREEGFTIIEVLIVLAIAGLIILIVFLAVPALQRNSRNTQRTNDASLIAAGINECLQNRNGDETACDQWSAAELMAYVDVDRLGQIETVQPGTTLPPAGDTTTVRWGFNRRCNDAGSDQRGGADVTDRDFVVLYRFESTNPANNPGRCVTS